MNKILPARVAARTAVLALACALVDAAPASAQQRAEFGLSLGATHSDNIGRTAQDEVSETTAAAGVQFNVVRSGGRLDLDAAADLQYRSYLDDTFGDEVVGGLSGRLVYAFVPDRFTWTVQNNYGQTLVDRRLVETPDNRQDTNYFSTGPDWIVPVGGRTQLRLQARWADARYDATDADNQRYSGAIGLTRALGRGSSLSLNGRAERVEYQDVLPGLDFEYDFVTGFLGYRIEGARTTLELQGGYTSVDGGGPSFDGPLFGVVVTRQLTQRSTLEFSAGTELTDTTQAFSRDQLLAGVDAGSGTVIVNRDPLQSDYAALAVNLAGGRQTLRLGADWRRDRQETLNEFDRDRLGASIGLSRELTPRLRGTLAAAFAREELDNLATDFDEWSVGAGLEWALSSAVGVTLRADRIEGSGEVSGVAGSRDYTENRFSLFLTYAPRR